MSTRYFVRFGLDVPSAGSATGTLVRAPGSIEFAYPQALGGLQLGPTAATLSLLDNGGWASGDDELVRGRWRRGNSVAALTYRIDLPGGPGQYRVWAGVGAASYQRNRWQLRDGVGGTVRADVQSASTGLWGSDEPTNLDQWAIATSTSAAATVGPIDLSILDPEPTPLVLQFDSGVLELLNGAHPSGGFSSDLSFFAFEKIDTGPAGPSAAVLRRRRFTPFF